MTGVADELQVSSGPSGADPAIGRAVHALLKSQQKDGHWVFELEADATIPAEYVLLRHYRGEPRDAGWNRKSQSICGASRERTAAGRSITTATST